jgi:hypothetical protein
VNVDNLYDPAIRIANLAAIGHVSPHKEGLTKNKHVSSSKVIAMGKGVDKYSRKMMILMDLFISRMRVHLHASWLSR